MIKRAGMSEAGELAGLAAQLWTDHAPEELTEEFRRLVMHDDAVCFIKYADDKPIAFAQCQLRHDYVEGMDSSPVGYLEGIFVAEGYRKHGISKRHQQRHKNHVFPLVTQRGARHRTVHRELLHKQLCLCFLSFLRLLCFVLSLHILIEVSHSC